MYLYINTTERDSFTVALANQEDVVKTKTVKSIRQHSEKLLKSVQALLKSTKVSLSDIKGIAVVKGPGSFVSLRIGISTANALAYSLKVPIIGIDKSTETSTISASLFSKKKHQLVAPEYGREPDTN